MASSAPATDPRPVWSLKGPDMSVSTPIFTTLSDTCAAAGAAKASKASAPQVSRLMFPSKWLA